MYISSNLNEVLAAALATSIRSALPTSPNQPVFSWCNTSADSGDCQWHTVYMVSHESRQHPASSLPLLHTIKNLPQSFNTFFSIAFTSGSKNAACPLGVPIA